MTKIDIGAQNGFTMPMPQAILATKMDGKPNYMALGWVTRVNYKPALMACAVNKNHASNSAIRAHPHYSINFPSTNLVAKTDYAGLVSGKRVDKSGLFETFYGNLGDAPMITQCPFSVELELFELLDLPTNTLFIGEVRGTWTSDEYLTAGVLDPKKVNPFSLTMPDNRYWSLGEHVGDAWSDGKALK